MAALYMLCMACGGCTLNIVYDRVIAALYKMCMGVLWLHCTCCVWRVMASLYILSMVLRLTFTYCV